MWMGLDDREARAALEGVMPWFVPTGKLAVEALRKLDRPLVAWAPESRACLFDAAACYADCADEPGGLSPLGVRILIFAG
ncbi:hypothetical protein SNOUR_07355 [Streptomyces noursei ATCC 11455]|uniref:hypothetical protein n=1 Tax=Streptomyces noursei TaxID=1971 RepID=UPI00081C6DF0|nr:hypothetical protein SNOUR_07355 [Streptomyces noursei ATCC 11455]